VEEGRGGLMQSGAVGGSKQDAHVPFEREIRSEFKRAIAQFNPKATLVAIAAPFPKSQDPLGVETMRRIGVIN
jgi:hypothetical protein